ncbi:MAG: DUF4316 domain-containing protein [Clostridia bacterium]|nr:DUF4316 domain-containing protein [Clostridia bacterium]MBR6953939.1 DUF4316 domain-containing protein [Clostridia bacterium]
MPDNSYAIYQLKDGPDYHMLRFASLDDLNRDALRLRRDVHKILETAEGIFFPDKAAAEQYLRDAGFTVIPNTDSQMISVRNAVMQESVLYLSIGANCCWLEGCDTRAVDQSIRSAHYDLIYTGTLPSDDTREPLAILESLYARFNLDRPADFHGHSLSVSDVIALRQHDTIRCYYTDSFGFRELPDFMPDNPLRNAEMTLEDDYGMIDGIINNGPKQERNPETPVVPGAADTPHEGHHKERKHPKGPER